MFNIRLDPDLGQHFLLSKSILKKEVEIAGVQENDVVLDIGAGFGFLTEEIAKKVSKVYAIEIDEKVFQAFSWRLRDKIEAKKIIPILGDILEIDVPKDVTVIISNPPYQIISLLIIKLLREVFSRENFKTAVMILQRDYVVRLFAKPGSKNWGRVSAAFRYYAKGKIIEKVPRYIFFPIPKVDSVLVKMCPIHKEHLVPFGLFEKTTNILFTSPNKKVKKVLKMFIGRVGKGTGWKPLIEELKRIINIEKRIRQLTVDDIEFIALFLKEKGLM